MHLPNAIRRLTSWTAILAVLLLSFAPLVSQALGPDQYGAWVEICSANGAKWVKAADGAPSVPKSAHALEHCPYCSVHVSALGMPPSMALPMPDGARFDPPRAFVAAPYTLHAWRSAQPRGPPHLA